MMTPRLKILSSCLAMAAMSATLAAHADDDRFTLRLGAMQADAQSTFSGNVLFDGNEYDYTSNRIDLDHSVVPRVEGAFHFGQRHRLLFNYFQYDKDRRYTLGQDVTFEDTTIPAGSSARAKAEFALGSVLYDYAVVETPTTSFGLQIGAEWARLKGRVSADDGTNSFDGSASENGTAPVVGARFAMNSQDQKWRFTVQGQYLNADWGDFGDYEGDISRANAIVEYRFTPHFGLYAGYDWFKLDVKRNTGDNGSIELDQRFKGPIAGVTFAF
jgi:opacity protein-like surface antigen